MKHGAKGLFVATLCAAALSPSVAQAQMLGRMDLGLYVGGGAGMSKSELDTTGFSGSTDERDTGWKIFGGYQFHRFAAVELGYYDLGKTTFNGTITAAVPPFPAGTATSGSFKTRAGSLSLLGILPLGDTGFSVNGRLGIAYSKQKASFRLGGLSGSTDDDATEFTYGLGARFDFTRNLGVRGEWERFRVGGSNTGGKNDIDLYTLNLLYRF